MLVFYYSYKVKPTINTFVKLLLEKYYIQKGMEY